jgi:hypothetical protein
MHLSSNMLQSVENFNAQTKILGNYVRDVDIFKLVYYSFVDTNWNYKDKFRYSNYDAKSICRFLRANLMLLELSILNVNY